MDTAKEPKVCVIIPAWNCQDFIGAAVASILAQPCANIEILIVDDASTDETARTVRALAALHPQVKLLANEGKKGPAGARNTALKKASGDYIGFLDADDVWLPNHLEGIAFLEQHPEIGVLFFNFNVVKYATQEVVEDWFSAHHAPRSLKSEPMAGGVARITEPMFDALIGESFMHLQSMLVRASVCRDILFNEALRRSEDRDFAVQLAMRAKAQFAYSEEKTGKYYLHPNNLTAPSLQNEITTTDAHIAIFSDYLTRYPLTDAQREKLKKLTAQRCLDNSYANRELGFYGKAASRAWESFTRGHSARALVALAKIAVLRVVRPKGKE